MPRHEAAARNAAAAAKAGKPAPERIETPTDESPLYHFPTLEPPMAPPYLGTETPTTMPDEDMWLEPGVPPSLETQEYILDPMRIDPVNGPVP